MISSFFQHPILRKVTKRFELLIIPSLHYTSCHPTSAKIGLVKGDALRLLRTNSSKSVIEENISNFYNKLVGKRFSLTIADVTSGPREIAQTSLPSMCDFVCQDKTFVESRVYYLLVQHFRREKSLGVVLFG